MATGDVIVREGDVESSSLFIIEEGQIDISYGLGRARVDLAILELGQDFGELSLFDGAPRSATATDAEADGAPSRAR